MDTVGSLTCAPFRILVAVTFHFNPGRLWLLFRTLRSLADFPVAALDVVVVTNAADADRLRQIEELCAPLFRPLPARGGRKTFAIRPFDGLADPWRLTWCHKPLITEQFLAGGSDHTHFLYIEDDVRLSFEGFCYFVHYRERLRARRLIPSFQRIEYNELDNRLYALDQKGVSDFSARVRVDLDGYAFVNPDFPFAAMFILDADLAREYVATRSFDFERSKEVRPLYGTPERAAMGLCFEDPPPGFACRYVLPVDPTTLTTPGWAWTYHLANNYAKDPRTAHAKTRPEQVFGPADAITWRPPRDPPRYVRRGFRKLARLIRT